MKARPIFGLVFLLAAGCASLDSPLPEDYRGPVARIQDSSQEISSTKVQFFELAKVEGRKVRTSVAATYQENQGRGFTMEPIVASRRVPAVKCVLFLEGVTYVAADILAFGGHMYHVEGEVTADLEEGKVYTVKGTLGKDYSAVWLEDDKGRIVSPKVEKGRTPAGS